MIDQIQQRILEEVADLHEVPEGAYNIRTNGQMAGRNTTTNIDIVSKIDVSGIDIRIKPGTKHESVHIPVVLSQSGLKEMVYNDFYIGEDSDIVIVAGCGIHNCGDQDSEHDGIHRFYVGKNAKVKYVEKHYGEGDGHGKRILNPGTEVYMEEGSFMEMCGFHGKKNHCSVGGGSQADCSGAFDDSRQPACGQRLYRGIERSWRQCGCGISFRSQR